MNLIMIQLHILVSFNSKIPILSVPGINNSELQYSSQYPTPDTFWFGWLAMFGPSEYQARYSDGYCTFSNCTQDLKIDICETKEQVPRLSSCGQQCLRCTLHNLRGDLLQLLTVRLHYDSDLKLRQSWVNLHSQWRHTPQSLGWSRGCCRCSVETLSSRNLE